MITAMSAAWPQTFRIEADTEHLHNTDWADDVTAWRRKARPAPCELLGLDAPSV